MGLLSKAAVNKTEPLSGALPDPQPEDELPLRVFLEAFGEEYDFFHFIALQADVEAVRDMTGTLGAVTSLDSGGSLVLLPISADRELIAHRLAKSLNAEILCQCEADSVDTALSVLQTGVSGSCL